MKKRDILKKLPRLVILFPKVERLGLDQDVCRGNASRKGRKKLSVLSAGSNVAETLSKLRGRKVCVWLGNMDVAEDFDKSNFGGVVRMETKLKWVKE